MEIASIPSLPGSTPAAGFNPNDLKQLDDQNGAIINRELYKKVAEDNRKLEERASKIVLQREHEERMQLAQRYAKEQEEKARATLEKRKSDNNFPTNGQMAQLGQPPAYHPGHLQQNHGLGVPMNNNFPVTPNGHMQNGVNKMADRKRKIAHDGNETNNWQQENAMLAKRKPEQQWMSQSFPGQMHAQQMQFYMQPGHPQAMMMPRQNSQPMLQNIPQNGYDVNQMNPAFRPNGLNNQMNQMAQQHQFPAQAQPQMFASVPTGCTQMPSTSAASSIPNSAYPSNLQNPQLSDNRYGQQSDNTNASAHFQNPQAPSPATNNPINMNQSPNNQGNPNPSSISSTQHRPESNSADGQNRNVTSSNGELDNINSPPQIEQFLNLENMSGEMPNLNVDDIDELDQNNSATNNSQNQPSVSSNGQNDAQNGIVLPPSASNLSASHVMSPQNQMGYATTPHSVNGPSSVHSVHSNPLSNGNCATPITPGSSQLAPPVGNRPPSNSMQPLQRTPSVPNTNTFVQQQTANVIPMQQQNGPVMVVQQPNPQMQQMMMQQQQQQQQVAMMQGQPMTQSGPSYYAAHPGMQTQSMTPHPMMQTGNAYAQHAAALQQTQYQRYMQQHQMMMMQRQGMQVIHPQYMGQMQMRTVAMTESQNSMQGHQQMMDSRMTQKFQLEMMHPGNFTAYQNGIHPTMMYQQPQQRLQAAQTGHPNYPAIN